MGVVPDAFNYFLTAGIRQGDLLHHLNNSRKKDIGPDIGRDLPMDSPFYDIGKEVRKAFLRGRTCWTLGLRWDFMKSLYSSIVVLALWGVPCHAELLVIVHPDAPVESLSKEEIARIFLKKSKTFPDGHEVVPLSQPDFPEKEDRFFFAITDKNRTQLSAYWARLMFTGKARPPLNGKDDQTIKSKVSQDRRYVGYIDATSLDASVKVLHKLDER